MNELAERQVAAHLSNHFALAWSSTAFLVFKTSNWELKRAARTYVTAQFTRSVMNSCNTGDSIVALRPLRAGKSIFMLTSTGHRPIRWMSVDGGCQICGRQLFQSLDFLVRFMAFNAVEELEPCG
jgi:hypothetical protein